MKAIALLSIFIAVLTAHTAEPLAKIPIEFDGKKLVYSDFVRISTGGAPAEHFILVHDDIPEFRDARVTGADVPYRPYVPYVIVGKTKFPLSQFGVYLLKKDGDSIVVEFLVADLPKKEDQKSVEEFIRIMLKKPTTEKEFIEWMRTYLDKK